MYIRKLLVKSDIILTLISLLGDLLEPATADAVHEYEADREGTTRFLNFPPAGCNISNEKVGSKLKTDLISSKMSPSVISDINRIFPLKLLWHMNSRLLEERGILTVLFSSLKSFVTGYSTEFNDPSSSDGQPNQSPLLYYSPRLSRRQLDQNPGGFSCSSPDPGPSGYTRSSQDSGPQYNGTIVFLFLGQTASRLMESTSL
jgi:hypothetical protein